MPSISSFDQNPFDEDEVQLVPEQSEEDVADDHDIDQDQDDLSVSTSESSDLDEFTPLLETILVLANSNSEHR